jgi:uncharacterized membrane protein HdeD (DUF308 family)
MLEPLSRYWWVLLMRGVFALLFGLLAIIWPEITVLVLVLLFGAYVLVDGLSALASAFVGGRSAGRRTWLIVEGVLGVLFGLVTLIWPDVTTLVLLWLIAAWALVTGFVEILLAVRLRQEIRGEWLLGLSGALSILFGLLLAFWPATGAVALVVLIGVFAVIYGIVLIALSLRLRTLRQEVAVPGQPLEA